MAQFGLGRGLDALIPRNNVFSPTPPAVAAVFETQNSGGGLLEIPLDAIKPNRFQPRTEFDKEALADLASSIKEYGILQPLVVEEVNGQYFLIAGERRLRAARMAGLHTAPAVVRSPDDHQRLALAIIENIQRVNLNPIETAIAYQRLVDDFNLTQEQVAAKMGRSRASIANTLRLLRLHPEIQEALCKGMISEGHGKLLLGIEDLEAQHQAYKNILANNLSVGDAVHHIKPLRKKGSSLTSYIDPNIAAKETALREHFGTKVRIQYKKGKGTISIEYYSDEEFRSLLNQLLNE